MSKIEVETRIGPFIKPVVLVGAMIDGQPNFMNVVWLTRLTFTPNIWGLSIGETKHTVRGIRDNKKFSINIASVDMATKTDYCGLVSGREVNKAELFDVFYGELEDVPMISECPINVECTVYQIVEFLGREVIFGEVKHLYSEEKYLTDGVLDQAKINPLLYSAPGNHYWAIGDRVGDAFSIGKSLKKP
jgi:flavin reductase (DIM6/NTAB) family NADH-FMN oxidoreductase RutF